jgi:hypothetical protein
MQVWRISDTNISTIYGNPAVVFAGAKIKVNIPVIFMNTWRGDSRQAKNEGTIFMKHARILAAAAAMAIATAAPAQADPFKFVITGDYSASFILDSSPSPDDGIVGLYFTLWDIEGFPDAIFGLADVHFYNGSFGGGIGIEDFYGDTFLLLTDGPQLYSGGEDAPTFLTGTYGLTEYQGTGTYSLTISAVSAAVPEPAAWGMMIGGFGLAGAAMRRRGYAKGITKVAFAA